ncbi:hypothetical protein BsWGS_06843 [Bradybaena similaris]
MFYNSPTASSVYFREYLMFYNSPTASSVYFREYLMFYNSPTASSVCFREYLMFQSYLESTVVKAGYNPTQGVKLGSVTFYGVSKSPGTVTVNGVPATFNYDASLKVVNVNNLASDLLKPLRVLLN